MGKIKKLIENELVGGTQTTDVYPVTSVKAVYDENNERLDHILNRRGVVNISTNYNSDHIAEVLTLAQALSKVPSTDRVLGFQGKYLASDGWHTIIYNGDSLTSWSDKTKWIDLADKVFNSISKNATFAGIATPATNPGTPDGPVFYIAAEPGIYANFNDIEITGEAVILEWRGSWVKKPTGLALQQQLSYKTCIVSNVYSNTISIDTHERKITIDTGLIYLTYGASVDFKEVKISEKYEESFQNISGGLCCLFFNTNTNRFEVKSYSLLPITDSNYLLIAVFSISNHALYYTTSIVTFNGSICKPFSAIGFAGSYAENQLDIVIGGNINIDTLNKKLTINKNGLFHILGNNFVFASISGDTDIIDIPFERTDIQSGLYFVIFDVKLNSYRCICFTDTKTIDKDNSFLLAIFDVSGNSDANSFWTTSPQSVSLNGKIYSHIDNTRRLDMWDDYVIKSVSNQLFNKDKVKNAYIDPNTGKGISNSSAKLSDYIECLGKGHLYIYTETEHKYAAYVAFYAEDKSYISHSVGINLHSKRGYVKIPANAHYLRMTIKTSAPGELYEPDTIYMAFDPSKSNRGDDRYLQVFHKLKGNLTQYLPKLATGMNLFNGKYITGYINTNGDGTYVFDNNGAVSDFIFCKGQKRIYTHVERTKGFGLFYGFYNENREPIAGGLAIDMNAKSGSYEIPIDAIYVRQGVVAINEDKTDLSDCYIGFMPYPGKEVPQTFQYGTDEMKFTPGKINRLPIDDDDPVNLYALKQYSQIADIWLYNKVYFSLGDSITAPMNGYASKIAKRFNMQWTNFGVSGCHWVNYEDTKVDFSSNPTHSELSNQHSMNVIQNQVYRVLQMITPTDQIVPEIDSSTEFYETYSYPVMGTGLVSPNDVSLITIACGTNDASNSKPIGALTEVDTADYKTLDRKTLWSAIKWAVNVLRLYLPNTKIVILAPIQRSGATRAKLWTYVDNEIQAANQFACPCINMFNEVEIMAEIETVEHRYLKDGLHPNDAGATLMANLISSKLLSWYRY